MSDFGSAFAPVKLAPPPPALFDPERLAQAVAEAVTAAISAMVLPAPQVNVDPPDLSELVNAVVGIKGPASANEIAEALAPLVRPPGQAPAPPDLSVLTGLKDALEKLEFRLKGPAFGGGGGGTVRLDAADTAALAKENTLSEVLAAVRSVDLAATATYTTSGNHTFITPPAGQALRVGWLYAQAKGALDTGVVTVTFTLGAKVYEVELTGNQPFAHSTTWEGAANQSLVVNTSSTAAVIANADYTTFTP